MPDCPWFATVPVVTFNGWVYDLCPAHARATVDPLAKVPRMS